MVRLLRRWLGCFGSEPLDQDEPMFAVVRRDPRDVLVSFWANGSLYEDIRSFGDRDASRFMRSSIALGLGLFREHPGLMKRLDTRAKQAHHVTVWVDEATAGRIVTISKGQQSRFIRASIEFGLVFFRAHPEVISILDGGRPE